MQIRATVLMFGLRLGLGLGSALGVGLGLVGIVDFRNSGPESIQWFSLLSCFIVCFSHVPIAIIE